MPLFASLRANQDTPLGRRAPHRVAYELMRRIKAGVYSQGEWLPTEQKLLSEFSVSRTALRQALVVLECLNLVESHHGTGSQVVGGAPSGVSNVPGSVDLMTLLEACRAFEIQTAGMASALPPGEAVAPSWPEVSRKPLTPDHCRRFHVALAEATGNTVVAASIRNLWDVALGRMEMRDALDAALARSGREIGRLQRSVMDALALSDPPAARTAVADLFDAYLAALVEIESRERLALVARENAERRERWSRRLVAGADAPARQRS